MSTSNGKIINFNMDQYTRKTLSEKARLRQKESRDTLRELQKNMFDRYGTKWMRPIGKALIPSAMWEKIALLPVRGVSWLVSSLCAWYMFIMVGWRVRLGKWMYLGGVGHKMEMIKPGLVKVSIIVGKKVVEEMEVRV